MHLKAKKMAVLRQLAQEQTLMSIHQLLAKLPDGFTERSLRRWLAAMAKEGLVEKQGNKRSTRYQMALSDSYHTGHISERFSFKSAEVLNQIKRPLYERTPVAYAIDWLDEYQPNVTFYIPSAIRIQLHDAGIRTNAADPAGTYAHQIFNRLLIDLSYNSSRLEGNTYSLLETEKLILQGKDAEGKLDEEKIMILNHKEAIRYLVDSAAILIPNQQSICTLHYLLSDSLVDAHYSGKVRDHGVRISGSTYIPYENKNQLQQQLDKILKKASLIENPHEQSLFLLIHISYLQYFIDVNKRTARLSANIPLIKHNVVPLSFNDVERDDYNSAMIAVYELQNITPMLELYVFSYLRTCAIYDATIKSIGVDELRARYREQRRAVIRDIILNKVAKSDVKQYTSTKVIKLIPDNDKAAFIEDVLEDINEIDKNRLAGLGVTSAQLEEWINQCS